MATNTHHPTAMRNRIPILEALKTILKNERIERALEVASGSGAHVEVFAAEFAQTTWQPTEYIAPDQAVTGEEAYAKYGKIGNLKDPLDILDRNLSHFSNVQKALALDLTDRISIETFKQQSYDLVHVGNVLHVCPVQGVEGLFQLSSHVLKPSGILTIYGPFKRSGAFTTESNQQFDETLKTMNPDFGLRDVELQVVPVAIRYGFGLNQIIDMPANNFLLVFRHAPSL